MPRADRLPLTLTLPGRWRRTLALPRTLRARLIAGLVALLAIACATVGVVTYIAVQRSLASEVDSQLQTATSLANKCLDSQLSGGDNDPDDRTGAKTPGNSAPASAEGLEPAGSGQDERPAAVSAPSPTAVPSPSALPSSSAHASQAANSAQTAQPGGAAGTGTIYRTGTGTGKPSANQPQDLYCDGIGNGIFLAYVQGNTWHARIVPSNTTITLSADDKHDLLSIPAMSPQAVAAAAPSDSHVPTSTRYLRSLGAASGEFALTALRDPDGDTYITGVPLSETHDALREVALTESAVFGGVLLLAGVLGTLWVRFSLRPLRRVAVTASQVAELPLESGEVSLPAGVPDTDPATETGQVGLAFNRMLGHVQTALRRRAASEARLRRFAADASHELRTPLAAIRGYAELAMLHPGDSPEAVTHALSRVLAESTRMSVLVDDLLLLARLDAGRPLTQAPVDMTRLAIDATSDAQVARRGHRWVLELPDDPVQVRGDEHRLRQVLANLLSNAGRHTPDGSTVTVRVSDRLPEGEPGSGQESVRHGTIPAEPRVVLTVTDDGPGIPPGLLPDLFERFTRADTSRSHAANANSTGLGLAIVDAVIAAHNGAVLVTSHPGMTRFTIVLPQLAPPAAQPERRPRPGRKSLNKT